jgi:hypothetical protein
VTEVILAAAELQAVCQSQDWQFCFIGGLALQRWGEPRETVDVDLTLLTGFGGEEQFIQVLLEHFEGRIPDAGEFARQRRVLLLRSRKGVGLDIALGALPFEETDQHAVVTFTLRCALVTLLGIICKQGFEPHLTLPLVSPSVLQTQVAQLSQLAGCARLYSFPATDCIDYSTSSVCQLSS